MRLGAFVDVTRVKQFTEEDFSLPETPPFSWLLRNKRDETGSSGENLASSPSDENSASLLNTMTPAVAATLASQASSTAQQTTNNNNATVKSLENSKATAASASPKGSTEQLVGTSPSSLGGDFKRSSSRWSTRTLPEDEKLLKELHFPFATQNTPISDLAKFYRECFNAPPLQQFSEAVEPEPGCDDEAASVAATAAANAAAATIAAARNNSIDDLTQQLERFETSLNDYDTLVTSLCQQSHDNVDSNSNS